ncbi:hypothetical protein DFP72DRAFT_912652 [Ephemerocybe angulata]|uniref:Uncharacterized protein n=1 Tax=Ephemerocybe angulata TaxID=980116 RepID=A0A8H6LZE6_9AGAR|nr:hypothetical protein DFP72DRAFT_912652 [Tulosesus angulatus]
MQTVTVETKCRNDAENDSQQAIQHGATDHGNLAPSQSLTVGKMAMAIVSGNYTYNVTVVNNYGSTTLESYDSLDAPLQEIIAWLQGPKFLHLYEEALTQRLSTTGTWFIESDEFRELVEGRDVIVWATGIPGTGKTVMSSVSFEHLKQIFHGQAAIGIVGAYVRYAERQSTRDIFAGLLSQLIEDHSCVYSYLRHTHTQRKRAALTEAGMIKAFQDIVRLFAKVFLVIDGLDEAEDNVKEVLLRLLPSLGANVLITSRPLDLYVHHLPNARHISIEARAEDIDRFVEVTVNSSSKLQSILNNDPALADKLKTCVRETSKGMFSLARLQMENVLNKARSVRSLLETLNQLPSGVEDLYGPTLSRITAQSAEDVSCAHRVFTWILHSVRGLTAEELQGALAVSFEDQTYDSKSIIPVPLILSMCGGLVTVEKRQKKKGKGASKIKSYIRFAHYTVHEFFKTVKFPELPLPYTYMAVVSLVYLRQHDHRLNAWDSQSDSKALQSYFKEYPFLTYADRNWGTHASFSQKDGLRLHPYIQAYLLGVTQYGLINHKFKSKPHFRPTIRATSLQLAAMYGLVDAVATKALPFSPPEQGLGAKTPFHYAARFNQPAVLGALVELYPGVNIPDENGKTPMMIACQNGHTNCVQVLIETPGVEVEPRDKSGRTAFWYACSCDRDAVPLLLLSSSLKFDLDVCDDEGKAAIDKAYDAGLERTVERLRLIRPDLYSRPSGKISMKNSAECIRSACVDYPNLAQGVLNRPVARTPSDPPSTSGKTLLIESTSIPGAGVQSGGMDPNNPPPSVREPQATRISSDEHNPKCRGAATSRTIVFFGETGIGKSAIIDMLFESEGKGPAPGRSDGSTLVNVEHILHLNDHSLSLKLWDTPGLSKSHCRGDDASPGELNLLKLLGDLTGSTDLLVYCVNGRRFRPIVRQMYDLVYSWACQEQVPILLVVNGLENEEIMEDWWEHDRGDFARHKMEFGAGHVCITSTRGRDKGSGTVEGERERVFDREFEGSIIILRKAIVRAVLQERVGLEWELLPRGDRSAKTNPEGHKGHKSWLQWPLPSRKSSNSKRARTL